MVSRRDRISSSARRVTEDAPEPWLQGLCRGRCGARSDAEPDAEGLRTSPLTPTPEQVYAVFRRSRIIGRRFRLVHVMFGQDTIEVSTFRANQSAGDDDHKKDEHGRLLRDNVFGNQRRGCPSVRRLHGQRALLRPRYRRDHRLLRWLRRREDADVAHDRRPQHPISRRPRPDAPSRPDSPQSSV